MSYHRKRIPVAERNIENFLLEPDYEPIDIKHEPTCKQRCCRCCIISGIIVLVSALLVFILLFVVLPVVFMHSIELQRNLLFQRYINNEVQEFTNFQKYGLEGARNMYIDVITNNQMITLGVWHCLPLALVHEAVEIEEYNYIEALHRSTYPVLLYFHDTDGNRIGHINKYRIFRRSFHVITFDYRGYGDSTEGELSEKLIIEDSVQIYKWLRSQTRAEIFVWGHSLGASLAAQTIARLRKENIIPTGLFLEAPFTTIREEMQYISVMKMYTWLPWFEATVLNPLEKNGFVFKTNESILSVDCPIMILHAKDDDVVPYILGEKLYSIAKEMRDEGIQGSVSLRLLPANLKCGHNNMYQALELPDYIKEHINVCRQYHHGETQ